MHVYISHLAFYFSITLVLEVKIAESFKDSHARCVLGTRLQGLDLPAHRGLRGQGHAPRGNRRRGSWWSAGQLASWSAGQLVVFVSHYATFPAGETDVIGN